MRVNVYTEEWSGEYELVTKDNTEDGGEYLDGIRLLNAPIDDESGATDGVTIWLPIDRYEQTADMFEAVAQSIRGLAKQRERM